MEGNYWRKALASRMTRRRALIAGSSVAAAAAFLAACGSDDGGGGAGGTGGTGANSLITKPQDTSSQAKRGGVLKDIHNFDPPTLDPAAPVAPLNAIIRHTYGTLIAEKAGVLEPSSGVISPDLAESWEVSPDKLTINLRLRQGVKWHNKAPVNGRLVDVDDVTFSWARYSRLSPFRALSSNAVNPNAPVLSVSSTDSRTIQIKLKEPLAYALNYFGSYGSFSGNVIMLPKEADNGLDLRGNIVGHGPFEVAEYQPSVGFTLKRHADYYDKDFAFVDQINMPIVPEYAARLAQLKAGSVHRLPSPPNGEDVMVVKRDEPRLLLYETDYTAQPWIVSFGWLQEPFRDERVRQAVSMAIDRDTWIDAIQNVSGFEKDGLPVETRWNTHLHSLYEDYWLDPKNSEFGPNAQYFKFNLAESKKLLAAAGYPNGFTVTSTYPVEGLDLRRFAEPFDGMLREIFDVKGNNPNYANEYIPKWRDSQGQYEGWLHGSVTGTMPQFLHPVSSFAAEYWPKGGTTFRGFSVGNANDKSGDPTLTAMIEKARLEFDNAALKKQVHDIQRYLAKAMWGLMLPGGATSFDLAWPALKNFNVFRVKQGASPVWNAYRLWIDNTLPPS